MAVPVARTTMSRSILPRLSPSSTSVRPITAFSAFQSSRHDRQKDGLASIQRRPFMATLPRPRDHHFDTLKFVERLKVEGFTEEQSVAMMKVLSDVIEER